MAMKDVSELRPRVEAGTRLDAMAEAERNFGKLHIACNNAGIPNAGHSDDRVLPGMSIIRPFTGVHTEVFVQRLVARVVHGAGYNLVGFTRASAVVNCQSALACFVLRSASHALTASFNTC